MGADAKTSLESAHEMTPYGATGQIHLTIATDFALHYGTGYTGFVYYVSTRQPECSYSNQSHLPLQFNVIST